MMQEMLQKQRQAMRERQAAARAAAAAAPAPAGPPTAAQPPAPSPILARAATPPPPTVPQPQPNGVSPSGAAAPPPPPPPQPWAQAGPSPGVSERYGGQWLASPGGQPSPRPTLGAAAGLPLGAANTHAQWGQTPPSWPPPPAAAQQQQQQQQWMAQQPPPPPPPPPAQPQQRQPPQQQQQPFASPQRDRRREPPTPPTPPPPPQQQQQPVSRGLPDLLPGLKTGKARKSVANSSAPGVGIDLLSLGSRPESGIVGSTRSAKADFAAPPPSARSPFPGSAWDTGRYQYEYGGAGGAWDGGAAGGGRGSGGGGGGEGLWPPSPAASAASTTRPGATGGPSLAQRAPLSLNPNMPYASPAGTVRQSPGAAAATAAAAAAAAAAGMNANGRTAEAAATPAGGAGTATGAAAAAGTTAESSANGAAAAAAAPAAAAKKKASRALWLTSFVQASGKGGSPSGGGGSAAAAAATAAAAAKQPVVDAGAAAAAMVRAAAERPARELAQAVSDLPATIPELQARLEAAVQAEQESELRALRALYASGSLRQLQREGVVLVGLTAAEAGRLYRSTLWRFGVAAAGKGSGGAAAGGTALPYHKLRPGASVIITAHTAAGDGGGGGGGGGGSAAGASVDAETGLPRDGVEGVVVEAHKDHLVVALEGRSHETFQAMVSEAARASAGAGRGGSGGRGGGRSSGGGGAAFSGWRLDQSVRDTTTRRHLEGIRRLGAWAEAAEEGRLGEARVRAVLAGSRSAALLAAEAPEWVKEDRWREDARSALAAQQGLNGSQRRAVAAALTRTVTLWQGPPGTGKTRTLLALIEVLVRVRNAAGTGPGPAAYTPRGSGRSGRSPTSSSSSRRAEAMGPVLAVADTNAAVDNIVEGLAARGVAAVRLGPAAKARESLRQLSLEAQAEATPLGRKAVALRAQALRKQELWRQAPRFGGGTGGLDAAAAAAQAAEIRADLERAEAALREAAVSVVAAAEVVVATCTAAGDSILDGRPWRCVVVDEASQATEPSVLVALTRGSAFVVMAGDPRQLPPTVLSEEALQHGLDVTLFERVAGAGGVLPLLLDTQYRMHPAISAFPSAFFYGGKLRDGVEAADKPVPRGFPWPHAAKPLALVQVTGGREETSGGVAEFAAAAAATTTTTTAVPAPGAAKGGARSGDRASYRNPAEALLALAVTQQLLAAGDVSSAAILTPYRGQVRLIEALSRQRGLEAAWAAAGLEVAVSTVDGYQGREADVVVFSAVRANDRGAVGFLSDPRRMNVAITRPRRGLVVLADTGTLTRGSADWNTYVKWARAQGVVVADEDVIDVEAALSAGGGGGRPAAASSSDADDAVGGSSSNSSSGGSGDGDGAASAAAAKASSSSRRGSRARSADAPSRLPSEPAAESVGVVGARGSQRRTKAVLESSELEEDADAEGAVGKAGEGPYEGSAAQRRRGRGQRKEREEEEGKEEGGPEAAGGEVEPVRVRRRRTKAAAV
ncbi:hypothetical protein PLESTF_000734600 [Pleodorina starrii]|nr:hypothetical protein PLESTF_000734600 [Pleodorina starrii]